MKTDRLLVVAASAALSLASCVVAENPAGSGSTSAGSVGTAPTSPEMGPPPDLRVRANGDIEVVFQHGCVAVFDRSGTLIMGGRDCDDVDLHRAREAVKAYLAEQDPSTYDDV